MLIETKVVGAVSAAVSVSQTIREWHDEALAELDALSGWVSLPDTLGRNTGLTIRVLHDPILLPRIDRDWRGKWGHETAWLEFGLRSEVDIAEFLQTLFDNNPGADDLDEPLAAAFARDVLSQDVARRAMDLVIAANIARPGSVLLPKLRQFGEDRLIRESPGCLNYFAETVDTIDELRWPTLSVHRIDSVLRWMDRVPGYIEGVPSGPSGVAMSALSELCATVQPSSPSASLMWAMVGIEALYAEGTDGLKRQIMAKTELTLGPRLDNKKRFNRLYDVRSRFVHGDIPFPLSYATDDVYTGNTAHEDLAEASHIAQAILLASLQRLIELNRYDFEFGYTLLA